MQSAVARIQSAFIFNSASWACLAEVSLTFFRCRFAPRKKNDTLNESHYTNPDELEIVTLEDALYLSMKNDLSFIISYELNLFEHQSTVSPNMPFRGFLYFASQYKTIAEKAGYRIYSRKLYKIPVPRYIIFYNGEESQPERQELRMSDAFERQDVQGCLECIATVLNINVGFNKKLHDTCKTLHDYAILIKQIRQNHTGEKSLEDAVNEAVEYCIKNDILADFLRKHRGEVSDMILTSYDEEAHMECIRQETREEMMEELQKKDLEILEKDQVIAEKDSAIVLKDSMLEEKDVLLNEQSVLISQLKTELEKLKKK